MQENIFREYDIRGIVGSELNERVVRAIGMALGEVMVERGVKTLSVGYDARLTASDMFRYLVSGLNKSKIEIYNIGLLPTPVGYYSVFTEKFDANIMITGSHNPKEYNGFKITIGKDSFFGQEIQTLKLRVKEILNADIEIADDVRAEEFDILTSYLEYLTTSFAHLKDLDLSIVCDAGNGTAGVVLEPLNEALNLNMKILYPKPDGNFPNHHPDPTLEENLIDIKNELRGEYNIGFAFDGDTDRVVTLTKKRDIKGDELAYLYALNLKEPKIIGEVKFSQSIFETINKFGTTYISKTGHSNIKKMLKEGNYDLGAEVSGHIFFKNRFFGFDDAIYAMMRVIEIVDNGTNLDLEIEKLPKVYDSGEIKIEVSDDTKFEIIEIFKEHLNELDLPEILEVIDIDGIRVHFEDGWALMRASNTTPILVARFEAKNEELKDELQTKFLKLVDEIKANL